MEKTDNDKKDGQTMEKMDKRWKRRTNDGKDGQTTDLNYWIKLLSCIIEANGGHIGLSHINLHWYY